MNLDHIEKDYTKIETVALSHAVLRVAFTISILTIGFGSTLYGQVKPLLVFDIQNGTVDSITDIVFDESIMANETDYFIGNYNSIIETLNQSAPFSNVFPNTNFTRKKRAAIDLDLSSFPMRSSVKIFSTTNGSTAGLCSGSMISRRHVLTATHCLTSFNSNELLRDSMSICPVFDNGLCGDEFSFTTVDKVYFFRDWDIFSEDIAILELSEPIGESTGWVSIGFNNADSILGNGVFYKFSYPGTTILAIDSNAYNGDTLYYNYGELNTFTENRIGITGANGIPGESGSSIIQVINGVKYTSYGTLTISAGLQHSRINNWKFYALENVIRGDLISSSIVPYENETVVIYPNPVEDILQIRTTKSENHIIKLSLFDKLGRSVIDKNSYLSQTFLDVSHLPSGLYFLEVTMNNGGHQILKVIKQ